MNARPIFEHEVTFAPERAAEVLRALPAGAGVVSLFGHAATDRPFLLGSANLRRRLQRLLMPAEGQTKRLNLRDRIARIAWRETYSEMESMLLLFRAFGTVFGVEEARRKMRLSPPFTVRYAVENPFPRIYVTNHLRRRSLHTTFGPFASRLSADRYREAVEELFVIRRCFMELHPSPDDPGCIYGEMHKCMAPCQARCSEEEYVAESTRTLAFLKTRGGSLVAELEVLRDRASAEMQFEEAATLHGRAVKARLVGALADELAGPLDELRMVLLVPCPAASTEAEPCVQLFLFADGCLRGPEVVSLLGVRLAKEQAEVGSSLFAQPMMLAAVSLDGGSISQTRDLSSGSGRDPGHPGAVADREQANPSPVDELRVRNDKVQADATGSSAEERMLLAIGRLEGLPGAEDVAVLGDYLAMLRRWYYRPEKQREGILFQQEKGVWPVRKLVRAGAKLMVPGETKSSVSSEAPMRAG